MALNLEGLLARRKAYRTREVKLGGDATVFIRELSVKGFNDWIDRDPGVNGRAMLIALSLSDIEGNPLCGVDDIQAVGELSDSDGRAIYEACVELNDLRRLFAPVAPAHGEDSPVEKADPKA